jgi:hypothetical protein
MDKRGAGSSRLGPARCRGFVISGVHFSNRLYSTRQSFRDTPTASGGERGRELLETLRGIIQVYGRQKGNIQNTIEKRTRSEIWVRTIIRITRKGPSRKGKGSRLSWKSRVLNINFNISCVILKTQSEDVEGFSLWHS